MTVIVHKDRDSIGYRFAIGRNTPRRIACFLGVFLYCVASTAAAVDSETWHYGLDNVGNITSRGTDSQNPTHNYGYDGVYRLTDESNPSNTDQYVYDSNSNRTSFTRDGSSTSYQIESSSNRLTQVGSDPRTYDNIGNTKTDRNGTRTFTYNQEGRLTQVHENSQLLATYIYNAQGQRTIKTTPNGTIYYLYDGGGQLLGEYDDTGQPIKEYVHVGDEPIAQVDTSNVTYLHVDHLATPRKATNEAGDVVWKWDSEAFGNKQPEGISGTTINLRFPGQYYDSETGFNYNYYRYYEPSTGRYITSDPIGLVGGLNTYAYVEMNPLNLFDPLGLRPCPDVEECLDFCYSAFNKCMKTATWFGKDCVENGTKRCSNLQTQRQKNACEAGVRLSCRAIQSAARLGCTEILAACTLACVFPTGDTPCDPCE